MTHFSRLVYVQGVYFKCESQELRKHFWAGKLLEGVGGLT